MTTLEEYLKTLTYETLLETALAHVPDNIDKREGSIIYDALAPTCFVLSEVYENMYALVLEMFAETASGEFLDRRVNEYGVKRFEATKTTRKATFLDYHGNIADVPYSTMFSTVSEADEALLFKVVGFNSQSNYYIVECTTSGNIGQNYEGALLPIDYGVQLASATIGEVLVPGRNVEDDETLRTRYFQSVSAKAFGGNVAQYKSLFQEYPGVGGVQVYPVWDGGGTVKVSVIDSNYNAASNTLINNLQEAMDPVEHTTEGIGKVPIGHRLSVVAPTETKINISGVVTPGSGYTIETLAPSIKEALDKHFLELRKKWFVSSSVNTYNVNIVLARIISIVLNVPGVVNISDVKLNGVAADVVLEQSPSVQELPLVGDLTWT